MKQDKKGFTLIELLAVIVILAIIALIAVPVIMNIISSARKSAFEDTAYGIVKAGELYYANALLNDGMTGDAEFTFTEGAVNQTGLSIQGSLPQSGKLVVTTDGKTAIAISNGTYCVTKGYEESKITTTDEFETCEIPEDKVAITLKDVVTTTTEVTSVATCATDGTVCAPGTAFAIEVVPGTVENFYVMSDEGNKVTLIMDSNIGTTIAWNTSGQNADGPITAIEYLEEQTNEWTNIPVFDYTYVDENNSKRYEDITRMGIRARLITKEEADSIRTNSWAYSNMAQPPYGYWTSATYTSGTLNLYAQYLVFNGSINYTSVNNATSYGVRPVIEIQK